MMRLLYLIPKNYLSYFLGKLAALKLPRPLAAFVIRSYARYYNIDLSLASKSILDYRSLADFFTRDLKNYPSPDSAPLVSPAEATFRSEGPVREGKIVQVKGIEYELNNLLGDDKRTAEFEGGQILNFYLSPSDYHQVHAPVNGRITGSSYIKGRLWPVNDWSLRNIPGLFAVNERLVTYIDSELGPMALVMIGATNVGKISVVYDDWLTNDIFNSKRLGPVTHRGYSDPITIKRGEKLGIFHMGSAVIIVSKNKLNIDKELVGKQVPLFAPLIRPDL